MKKGEIKDIFHKKWIEIGSTNNNSRSLLPVMPKNGQIEKMPVFSIGDSWTERGGDKVYFYKVAAIEDIAAPSGVYQCFKIIEEAEGGVKNYYWFAPGVGVVKWEIGKAKGILKKRLKEKSE